MTKKAAKRPTKKAPKVSTKKVDLKRPLHLKPGWTAQTASEAGNLVDDLREAIATSELSRYEIAKRAEISASLLSVFVNGQRSLTLDTAAKVATVLGLVLKPK